MSRRQPRSVYVRRRLLLLALVIALAWVAVRFWPTGEGDPEPTATSTITALPPSAAPTTPVPTTPATDFLTSVALPHSSKSCDSTKLTMLPSVVSPQQAKKVVFIDIAVTTSAKSPCTFSPESFDPLAVISQDDAAVWDSSVCKASLLPAPFVVVPGWATTLRVPWVPRGSGQKCEKDEGWVVPGEYTLRVGTLGGEPGKASFTLKPAPKPTPTPSTPAQPSAKSTKPATKPAAAPSP